MADLMNLLSGGLRGMGVSSIPGNFGLPPGFTPAPPQRPVGGFTPVPIEKLKALIMAEQAQKMNEAIIMKRAEEQMANEGFSRSQGGADILANTSPEEQTVADAIKKGISEEEFVKKADKSHFSDEIRTSFSNEFLGRNTEGNAGSPELEATAYLGNWFSSQERLEGIPSNLSKVTKASLPSEIKEYSSLSDLESVLKQYTDEGLSPKEAASALSKDLQKEGYKGISVNDEEFGGVSFAIFNPNDIRTESYLRTLYRQVKEKMGGNNQ